MEILSSARIGEEESMDIAGLLDTNKDHIVTYEEFYGALDGCPRPDIIQPIPVVDTRPIINTQGKYFIHTLGRELIYTLGRELIHTVGRELIHSLGR